VHRGRDLHAGDVHGDVVGDLAGQRLDVELARDVLEHAALLDAGRLLDPGQLDRDRGLDLLVEADLEQVDVHDLLAHGVDLLVLDDHRQGLGVADLGVEERAPREHLAQLAELDLE